MKYMDYKWTISALDCVVSKDGLTNVTLPLLKTNEPSEES
jgi:hypothetical protein